MPRRYPDTYTRILHYALPLSSFDMMAAVVNRAFSSSPELRTSVARMMADEIAAKRPGFDRFRFMSIAEGSSSLE